MGYVMVRERAGICVVNTGGYQLQDTRGKVIAGKKYDLSPQDILALCDAKDEWQATSVLGKKLREYCAEAGSSQRDMTVLSNENDPYRHDNESGHLSAKWFTDMVERFVGDGETVHLRGLHYRIVSAGNVMRPAWNAARCLQWVPYQNDFASWQFVSENGSEKARWLGYVPFERIVDERNSPPEIYTAEYLAETNRAHGHLSVGGLETYPIFSTSITVRGRVEYRQPYRIVLIGEKSSLRTVLMPIAESVQGELLLPNGELSITQLAAMCARAATDSRPTIVLYFSDFDPSGYHMPTNVARRIQAMRDLRWQDLKVEVIPVALTYEQVIEHDLPSTPLKPKELRAPGWMARWNHEQTEIDALAALRPEILRGIAIEATKPYFDHFASQRAYRREAQWESEATEILEAHPEYDESVERMEQAEADIEEAIGEAEETAHQVRETLGEIELPPIEPIEVELAESLIEPIYDSEDDWVEATLKLKARKDLVDETGDAD